MLRDLSSSRSAYGKYVLLLSLGLAQVASALPAPPQALSGRGILAVHRRDGHHDSNTTSSVGELQFTDARFTFYDPTEWPTGACGEDLANEDFTVALNGEQWDDKAHCGESVTIEYEGKTAVAKVMNSCMSCEEFSLDLTQGLFEYLAGPNWEDIGVIHGSWDFGEGSNTGQAFAQSEENCKRGEPGCEEDNCKRGEPGCEEEKQENCTRGEPDCGEEKNENCTRGESDCKEEEQENCTRGEPDCEDEKNENCTRGESDCKEEEQENCTRGESDCKEEEQENCTRGESDCKEEEQENCTRGEPDCDE